MKTLTINNRTFLAWPVEETPKDLQLLIRRGVNPVLVEWNGQDAKWQIGVPPGTYSDPFLLSRVDEERAMGMVGIDNGEDDETMWHDTMWRDYNNNGFACYTCLTALESFHSWLRANGVLTVNPMGGKEPDAKHDKYNHGAAFFKEDFRKDFYDWCRYQSQVSKEWIMIEQLKSK